MASTSYLCLGGVEITNDCRVTAYARNGLKPSTMTVRDCCCADLDRMLGDAPYRRPDLDQGVPWVDPNEPDSYDFGGLLVTSVTGLDGAQVERAVIDRIGDGAVIGRRRLRPRTIVVSGLLLGSTCCGVDYGLRWLASALQGSLQCGSGGCGGDDLEYLTCCPEICEDSPDFVSYEACAAPHFRTLREVALTSGPDVTGRIGGNCSCCPGCPAYEVQFTLTSGRPHALRQAVTVADAVTWDPDGPESPCVTWVVGDDCPDDDGCPEPDPCPLDPNCPTVTVPTLPTPINPCACEPFTRRRLCVDVPQTAAPIWADSVPVITINAGSQDLRGVRIRFYPNPLGRPFDELDACGFCAELNVSYLPASATITLDGTRRQAVVQCPGRADTPAGSIVSGPSGGPLVWPVLECGVPYLVCLEADSATIAPDARVSVMTVVREV